MTLQNCSLAPSSLHEGELPMTTFQTVTDTTLVERITAAQRRVVFVAPGVARGVAKALAAAYQRKSVSVTVILDSDEDAYRIGFGDPEGLTYLHDFAAQQEMLLRRQEGLRIGLLVVDDVVTIWSPTPRAVEGERQEGQPNAIVLEGKVTAQLEDAVGADQSNMLVTEAQIGTEPLRPEDTKQMVQALKENPPAPFDLSHKTRVFSTKFQFVEFELQGAEWTERKIKISSLLLNSDLPENLQDILETQIRPYQGTADIAFEAPYVVRGQLAYTESGKQILVPTKQADIENVWKDIRSRYLVKVKGFGWLIRKKDLDVFRKEIQAFEQLLHAWVQKFREHAANDETKLIENIVSSIKNRLERSSRKSEYEKINLTAEVTKGLHRMRVTEPRVRLVTKDVSWESTRDEEFTQALQEALPPKDLKGWFEEFTAARERR